VTAVLPPEYPFVVLVHVEARPSLGIRANGSGIRKPPTKTVGRSQRLNVGQAPHDDEGGSSTGIDHRNAFGKVLLLCAGTVSDVVMEEGVKMHGSRLRAIQSFVVVAACLVWLEHLACGQAFGQPLTAAHPPLPPVGKELSSMPGVSIVRQPDLKGWPVERNDPKGAPRFPHSASSSVGLNTIYFLGLKRATLTACQMSMPEVLAYAARVDGNRVFGWARLPEGAYNVKVTAHGGDGEKVVANLFRACEKAFHVRIKVENREQEVLILRRVENWVSDGFAPGSTTRTTYSGSERQPDDSFLNSFAFEAADIDTIRQQLEVATGKLVIDETGLKGAFKGITYRATEALSDLQRALSQRGLRLEPQARSLKALVIEDALSQEARSR
jgi:uncharacterized protein (TIGR03435 family)